MFVKSDWVNIKRDVHSSVSESNVFRVVKKKNQKIKSTRGIYKTEEMGREASGKMKDLQMKGIDLGEKLYHDSSDSQYNNQTNSVI